MDHLLNALRAHFDPLQDRMNSFARHGVQTEGWFKGELLVALDSLVHSGLVSSFDREVRHAAGRIDLFVESEGQHWIELKHWLIGEQRGSRYGPSFYFRDLSSVGVVKDTDKLLAIPGDVGRWLLLLLAENPGIDAWAAGVQGFNEKFAPRVLESRSKPSDFPTSYFLGLLLVSGGKKSEITSRDVSLQRSAPPASPLAAGVGQVDSNQD